MEIKITANRKKENLHKNDSTLARPIISVKEYYPLLELMFKELEEEQKENK